MSDAPVPNGTPPTSSPDFVRAVVPRPPPRVPDHELIRRIGRGAYGEVWLARSTTGAFRAVKIVHRQSFDHDRPFEREFEGILKFEPISRRHESQVDILHVGRGDDCFYYVMELADDQASGGQINPDQNTPRTLKSDLLFHGRLPFEECVRIGLALATALENLHGNGLAHRDVKPSNIIFVNGVPKLADIGLVAAVEATRSYVGTEGFAAPEGPGSAQADLYSLGKVLYEISTGKDRQEFPELPTQLRELPDREGLMELNAVIARACRHDPKDRYASATVMRTDLELLQSGKSLARLHRIEAQLRFVRRAGAVVTIMAALATGLYFWQARQTKLVGDLAAENSRLLSLKEAAHGRAVAAEREALRERDRARHSEQDTHRVLQFLLRRVVAAARPQDEEEGLGRDITVLKALQASEPAIPEAFAGQPLAELELRQSLAATFKLLGLATNEVAHR
ncbi:MAG: serine/threonine-protein kinase [Verrucomicrobiota bacterium]